MQIFHHKEDVLCMMHITTTAIHLSVYKHLGNYYVNFLNKRVCDECGITCNYINRPILWHSVWLGMTFRTYYQDCDG